jgi:hypothetical protein
VRLPRLDVVKALAGLRLAVAGFFRFDILPLAVRVAIHAEYAGLSMLARVPPRACRDGVARPSQPRAFCVLFTALRPAAFFRLAPVVAEVGESFSIDLRSVARLPTGACDGFFFVLAMWRYPGTKKD